MLLLISYCKIHFSQRSLYDPYKPLVAQRSSLARAPLFPWQVEVGDRVCHKATPPSTDVSWLFLKLSQLRQILLQSWAQVLISSLEWERKGLIGHTWQADTLVEMSAEFPPYLSHCFENILEEHFIYCLEVGVVRLSFYSILASIYSGRIDLPNHFLVNDWLSLKKKNKTKPTLPTGCLFWCFHAACVFHTSGPSHPLWSEA